MKKYWITKSIAFHCFPVSMPCISFRSAINIILFNPMHLLNPIKMNYRLPLTFITLLLFGFIIPLSAQAPNKVSYQAVIRDANGELVSNHSVRTKISLLQGSASGPVVYSEVHNVNSNVNGLV